MVFHRWYSNCRLSMKITKDNFDVLAIKAHQCIGCEGIEDILGDIAKFTHINKLFMKYISGDELNERLIMNHIVTLFNVFGSETIRFLFFKIKPEYYKALLPFLAYLNRLDKTVEIKNKMVSISKIGYDEYVLERLQQI
jgi:hypothetical protein